MYNPRSGMDWRGDDREGLVQGLEKKAAPDGKLLYSPRKELSNHRSWQPPNDGSHVGVLQA